MKTIILLVVWAGVAFPLVVSAQTPAQQYALPTLLPASLHGPLIVCTGAGTAAGVMNRTCNNLNDLLYQIVYLIYLAIDAVLWVVAPIMLMIGGVMYMLAGAKPDLESAAKTMITGVIFGVVIVLCAYVVIVSLVKYLRIGCLGNFDSNNNPCMPGGFLNADPSLPAWRLRTLVTVAPSSYPGTTTAITVRHRVISIRSQNSDHQS